MYMAEKYLPEAEHKTFSGNASGYLAISQGKLDGFVYDRVMMEFAIASGLEDVKILDENLGEHGCGCGNFTQKPDRRLKG